MKYQLAKIITSLYHSKEVVEQAMKYYDAAYTKKQFQMIYQPCYRT